jgi:glycosyltransferase involved in cell wall biosynthesis
MRADIWERLLAMNRLGYNIHALVIGQKAMPEGRWAAEMCRLVTSLRWVKRRPLCRCLAGIIPTCVQRNYGLAELPLSEEYDLTLMEAEDAIPICDNPQLRTKLRVLRVHNNEGAYMRELAQAEESFVRKQFWRLEALRLTPFSRSAYRRADSLWFISQSERRTFIANRPADAFKAFWLPPAIPLGNKAKVRQSQSGRVLFVGSLNIPINRDAIRWYLREVHVRLIQHSWYELVIAGSTHGRLSAKLFAKEISQQERCTVHLDMEDLTPLYNDCAVFVDPARRGAGVKLKNIHAMARGVPVVSTSVGNEGSGLSDKEHLRIADTPEGFATAIMELLTNDLLRQELADRAYCKLLTMYNCEANIRRLVTAFALDNAQPSRSYSTNLPG